ETHGWLTVETRQDPRGGQATNAYDFSKVLDQLEAAIVQDPADSRSLEADLAGETEADLNDTSFIARFGRVIASTGVAAIPQALFTYQAALQLSPQQVWF